MTAEELARYFRRPAGLWWVLLAVPWLGLGALAAEPHGGGVAQGWALGAFGVWVAAALVAGAVVVPALRRARSVLVPPAGGPPMAGGDEGGRPEELDEAAQAQLARSGCDSEPGGGGVRRTVRRGPGPYDLAAVKAPSPAGPPCGDRIFSRASVGRHNVYYQSVHTKVIEFVFAGATRNAKLLCCGPPCAGRRYEQRDAHAGPAGEGHVRPRRQCRHYVPGHSRGPADR